MKNKILLAALTFSISLSLTGCISAVTTKKSTTAADGSTTELTTMAPSTTTKELLSKWEESDCYSYYYKQLGKDVMPIGGWCAPAQTYNTDAQYALLKASGLNSIYGLYERVGIEDSAVIKALEYAEKYGIVYLVRDSSLGALADDEEDFVSHIEKYTKYSSYGGTLVQDEPGAKSFDSLSTVRKAFRQYASNYLCYVNLFPSYASGTQLSGTDESISYSEYLEEYLSTVQPQMLSYDYYGISGTYPNISKSYFAQLYTASTYANKYKVPFWTFISSCYFGGHSRVPTEAEIYWQVNTSLAYGAKGIQYFCYFHPVEFTNSGIIGGSFIDGSGNPTDIYYYGQKINSQIARMDQVLMHSTLISQMVYGDSAADDIDQPNLVTSFREVEEVEANGSVLIGCFDYNGKTALYIVNNSIEDTANVLVNFKQYVEATVYGPETDDKFAGNSLMLNMNAGEGILVELTNYK